MGLVDLVEACLVAVEGVGVLHRELPHADQTCPGAGIVAPLRLDLVDQEWQPLVGVDLAAGDVRDGLLMGHGEDHVASDPVLEAAHLLVDGVVAAGLLPDVGGVDDGHQDLLSSNPLHLLADDGLYLRRGAEAEGQEGEDSSSHLPDEARAQQIFVALAVGSVGSFPKGS